MGTVNMVVPVPGGALPRRLSRCGVWISLFIALIISGTAKADQLQGQSAGSASWIGGTVQGWNELAYIPARVVLTGGPVSGRTVTFLFDHTKASLPGIECLTGFTASPNVVITAGPTLSAPCGSDVWSYTLTVNLLDNNSGTIQFSPRLSAGAHLSTGLSVRLYVAALQILSPAAAAGSPDLTIAKWGPALAYPGSTITYTLSYTNKVTAANGASGVQLTDTLPDAVTYVPGSASGSATQVGNSLVWDLGYVPVGASGSVSYQVTLNTNAVPGQSFSGAAVIFCTQNDADAADNSASVTTTVLANCLPPEIAVNPVGATNYAGAPILFSAAASGGSPLSFQWRKNGSAIPGATGSLYRIASASNADAASYDLVVSNSCGVATSSAAMVGICQPISYSLLLSNHSFRIEVPSLTNRTYCVQYSADLVNWSTAPACLIGTGSLLQWTDTGAPQTACAPATTPRRFYRVVLLP